MSAAQKIIAWYELIIGVLSLYELLAQALSSLVQVFWLRLFHA